MARLRPPETCPLCGGKIPFIYRPLTEKQKMDGFVGDNGGHYDWQNHNCDKNSELYKKTMNKIIDGEIK